MSIGNKTFATSVKFNGDSLWLWNKLLWCNYKKEIFENKLEVKQHQGIVFYFWGSTLSAPRSWSYCRSITKCRWRNAFHFKSAHFYYIRLGISISLNTNTKWISAVNLRLCQLPRVGNWRLAREMRVYCHTEPASRSLIKLSPGSWNVIHSFRIKAGIICRHLAGDALIDKKSSGDDGAEFMSMVEG